MKRYLKKLFPSIEFYWGFAGSKLLVLVAISLLVGALDSFGLSLLIPILQYILVGQAADTASNPLSGILDSFINLMGIKHTAANIVAVFVTMMILKAVVKYFSLVYGWKLIASFNYKIKKSLVDKMFQLDFQEYLKLDTGKVSNVLSLEVDRCGVGFQYFVNYLVSFFTAFSFLVFLAVMAWRFALTLLFFGSFYYFFLRYINKKVKKLSVGITEESSKFNSLFIQVFHGFKYIKATASQLQLNIRLTALIRNLRDFKFSVMNLQGLRLVIQEPVILLMICAAVFVNIKFMQTEPTTIFLALILFQRATGYFMLAQNSWGTYIGQTGGTLAVMALNRHFHQQQEKLTGKAIVIFEKAISLRNVSFRYNNGKQVLKNLSLEIPKNATVAFVGRSGSGKSTLVNILTGILKPTEGQVLVDGVELADMDLIAWRASIGYVTQEPVVFNDSIRNNITLWQNDAVDEERMASVLQKAHVAEFIGKANGLDAMLADRGSNLSGGQRQRISIGREFYKEPQLIIFDEATSALDAESEAKIQSSIEDLNGEVTTIIVAHRLSTIRNADIIFLLDEGAIVASGSFNELMENRASGFYEFVRLQTIE